MAAKTRWAASAGVDGLAGPLEGAAAVSDAAGSVGADGDGPGEPCELAVDVHADTTTTSSAASVSERSPRLT
jgi:hypothetical protein